MWLYFFLPDINNSKNSIRENPGMNIVVDKSQNWQCWIKSFLPKKKIQPIDVKLNIFGQIWIQSKFWFYIWPLSDKNKCALKKIVLPLLFCTKKSLKFWEKTINYKRFLYNLKRNILLFCQIWRKKMLFIMNLVLLLIWNLTLKWFPKEKQRLLYASD